SAMERPSPDELHIIILDQGIGEKLVGGLLEGGGGMLAVGPLNLDVEDLARAHAGDTHDPERLQRPLDRLALRVEDAGFQRDDDAGLHRASSSRPPPVTWPLFPMSRIAAQNAACVL